MEVFLGTTPKGDTQKLAKGEASKGPAKRLAPILLKA